MHYQSVCRGLLPTLLLTLLCACSHDEAKKQRASDPVRVKTMAVADSNMGATRSYSGTVEAESGTDVSFSTAGTIKTLAVAEGDHVKKGQLIGTLDDGSLRNAYDIAAATLNQAKDAYNRMKMLHDAKSLPDIKWVDVQSKLSQAESAEKIARIALDDAKLYAPVSGVVSAKTASVGQVVAPGIPVVNIVALSAVKVSIAVPENEVAKFATGSSATITSRSAADKTFTGKLVEKGVSANPLSRSYSMKYQVDNHDGALLPGMICDVEIENKSEADGIVLPTSAVLLSADNTNFVWLDSAGVARRRMVVVGEMLPEGILIQSGLKEGEKVIVAGTDKVSQNTAVTSIN